MKANERSNSKNSSSNLSRNNNFSQKYFKYTKERKFLTPKKGLTTKTDIFKKDKINKKQFLETLGINQTGSKSPKIKINMEIKNLNIFGNSSNTNQPKKKLHKKTISALCQHQKDIKQKQIKTKTETKIKKHTKTKSQQNIKMSPVEWSELLVEHNKKKTKQQINLISKYAFCNTKGLSVEKKEKINQDTYIIIENFMMKDRYLFGVCDGHGVNGHYVSDFVKEILPQNMEYCFIKNKAIKKNTKNIIESTLKSSFIKTSKDLTQSGIDVNFSGSTACLTYIQDHQLYCSNLGDSRAVIFSRTGEEWALKQLSIDHKAEDERQAYRIKMNGGRVFPYLDQDGQQMGPYRIWLAEKNIPGLAMTRSFGDYVASTVGVIPEPETINYQITKNDKFMVIASDGLWQFISNKEVMDLVVPAFLRNNADQAVKILEKKALEAWKKEDENIDDITIIVIFFKYY